MESWKRNFRVNCYIDMTRKTFPEVGDWVSYLNYGEIGYILNVRPRMNSLSRRNPGNKTEKQILGTNIDYSLIVQGLDRDFNLACALNDTWHR